jgi:hypothetical protein
MSACFADAFYYLALFNQRDAAHHRVVEFTRNLSGQVITTDWILDEVGDAMAASRLRSRFQPAVDRLRQDPDVEVISASRDWFDQGLKLYHERSDKAWSLTDCISFVVMEERGLRDALTADKHFEQAGFVALLK